MKHVDAVHFWDVIERLDGLPLGSRPVVDIDIQEEGTFTEVSVGGRLIGEEVSCHHTGNARCYLAEEV